MRQALWKDSTMISSPREAANSASFDGDKTSAQTRPEDLEPRGAANDETAPDEPRGSTENNGYPSHAELLREELSETLETLVQEAQARALQEVQGHGEPCASRATDDETGTTAKTPDETESLLPQHVGSAAKRGSLVDTALATVPSGLRKRIEPLPAPVKRAALPAMGVAVVAFTIVRRLLRRAS
jgi:hypothetical protein